MLCDLAGCSLCDTLLTCSVCDFDMGYFINTTSNICMLCDLAGCSLCDTLSTCSVCDFDKGYFINNQSKCINCGLRCVTCNLLTASCTNCKTSFNLLNGKCSCTGNFFLNETSDKCLPCHSKCQTCIGPTQYECTSCFASQHRLILGTTCTCDAYVYK